MDSDTDVSVGQSKHSPAQHKTKADRCNERSERRRAEIMLVCAPTGPSNRASEHAYLHDLL